MKLPGEFFANANASLDEVDEYLAEFEATSIEETERLEAETKQLTTDKDELQSQVETLSAKVTKLEKDLDLSVARH